MNVIDQVIPKCDTLISDVRNILSETIICFQCYLKHDSSLTIKDNFFPPTCIILGIAVIQEPGTRIPQI